MMSPSPSSPSSLSSPHTVASVSHTSTNNIAHTHNQQEYGTNEWTKNKWRKGDESDSKIIQHLRVRVWPHIFVSYSFVNLLFMHMSCHYVPFRIQYIQQHKKASVYFRVLSPCFILCSFFSVLQSFCFCGFYSFYFGAKEQKKALKKWQRERKKEVSHKTSM